VRGKKVVVLLIITAFLMMMAVGCGDDNCQKMKTEAEVM
jgi:hypothetical protein